MQFSSRLAGQTITCLYRLHGTGNILKRHTGVVESVTTLTSGVPALIIREENGRYRTLRKDRMLDGKRVKNG